MLILSRKVGESLVIADDVVVTVLEIRNGQIRIGINAPRNVEVHREEIYARIAANKSDNAAQRTALDTVACKPNQGTTLSRSRVEQQL